MDRRFIIVHSSEIIRKGTQSILRDAFNVDFILLKSFNELQDYSSIKESELVILYDNKLAKEFNDNIEWLKKNENTVVQFKLCAEDVLGSNIININDSKSVIVKNIKSALADGTEKSITSNLSEREIEVLKQVALGFTNKEIADKLFISIHTVITHRKNITEKLGIKSISGLTVYAIINKLIDTNTIDIESLI